MLKKYVAMGLLVVMAVGVQAEPIRTALTKENRMPRLYQAELGAVFHYVERDDGELYSGVPYLRYTVLPDFSLFARVPYLNVDPDWGNSESGIGDVSLGFEFLAYEDLFKYPWIMPHAEVFMDTGDEEKGLGAGDPQYLLGLAIGTTTYRHFNYAVDARYRILDNQDNIPSIAGSLVWDLDDRFSLIGEIEVSREKEEGNDSHPITFLAGMHYAATDSFQFGLHGGTTTNSDVDVLVRGNLSYSF